MITPSPAPNDSPDDPVDPPPTYQRPTPSSPRATPEGTAPEDKTPEDAAAAEAKRQLRTELLARRRGLSSSQRATAAELLWAALLDRLPAGGRVAAYVPIGTEPGGRDLPERLRTTVREVLLPVVRPDRDLDWASYQGELTPAGHGLAEPPGDRLGVAAIAEVDLVVVPALAVDRAGRRLGRGGGSYDRALARIPADIPLVALLHDGELVDVVPTEAHDLAVSAAITPADGWVDVG